MNALLQLHLIDGPVPVVVDTLGIIALVAILGTRRWRKWLPIAIAVGLFGFFLGILTCWVLGDLLNLFGVTLSLASRIWFGIAVAGFFVGIARLIYSRKRFAAVWAASAVILALVGGLGLNGDLGEFPTVQNAIGLGQYTTMALPNTTRSVALTGWVAPRDLPAAGRIGTVIIPAATSNFTARPAVVYLPPAALVKNPPRLPVLELLSGQPGQPSDLFVKGALAGYLNQLARQNHGLAPIVVVPDQLGEPSNNPMCVNSALGNSATYVTVDVPKWINEHLAVEAGPGAWGIGGFSQGGTCSIQFGAALPKLYGTILDISGEVAPKSGNLQHTIDVGFAGSRAAYDAAVPDAVMHRVGGYQHTLALFAAGQNDSKYGPGLAIVARDAASTGMTAHLYISPGTAHDWRTVAFAFETTLPVIERHWGLDTSRLDD
ncbi:MAG: alpha/beta hydrolase-fold protein [Actinomycetota bacterium]